MTAANQKGVMLLEVMISLLIAAIALLGTVMMMTKSTRGEMESYQRVQALTLVQDMVSRINANRGVATCYSNGATGVVTNTTIPACTTGTASEQAIANSDLAAWKGRILGAAERSGASNVGAMIGAIGCVDEIDTLHQVFRVSVSWQGLMATAAPALTCGQGNYGNDDRLRRVVSVEVRIGDLSQ
ncbi:MAG: type IV pilus modification protein PilV [Lysobacterales bacterium 14-68-21]|jgi:type IV pilus assembly protein PilV|nr:MAG: type IV pilus modification protein PilV [Xanthomonadales bacterium 15-68-25]OZB66772.1 MAG: type IV pilus modification protein PilV [Xanthomonadales bacterium 14-68-21]